jgi:aryl-alcohol dehydrogenase-like predicted oxidoreductase
MLIDNQLTLGTAKLGMPAYGYSDGYALVDPVDFILRSLSRGIRFIDTSPRYGNSEELIGKALNLSKKKLSVSTKIDNLVSKSGNTPNSMIKSVNESISKLNAPIDICYLHQNDIEIISDKYVHEGIKVLKNSNLVKEVGTSVYSQEELMYSLDCGVYDWVQIPVNILDTSFYRIARNHVSGTKIAARSVFLQGVIFNDERARMNIKDHNELLDTLDQLRRLGSDFGITIQQLSVAYLSSLEKVNQIIVGTISDDKLIENMASIKIQLNKPLIADIEKIAYKSKSWTNPRSWKL